MGMMFFSNILDLRVDFFVLRRSLQFCGLLMLSIRLSNAGSLRRDARRLSTSDETFSCKGRSVSSSSVTSLTSSASWAQEDAFKSSLFPFLARGSVGLSSAAVYSPSPSEEFNKSFSSSCAGSYAAFNFLATGLTLESRLVAWSILWLSSSRSNSPVFLVCPVRVALGGLAAPVTAAFAVVPVWTSPEGRCELSRSFEVIICVLPSFEEADFYCWAACNCPSILFCSVIMGRWTSPLKRTDSPSQISTGCRRLTGKKLVG